VIDWNYEVKTDQRYWFQFKFRHKSVYFIYAKEFVCAFSMVIVFQFIVQQYLTLFRLRNFDEHETPEGAISACEENIKTYQTYTLIGMVYNFMLFLHIVQKLSFPIISGIKVPFDFWLFIDIATAVCNIFVIQQTSRLTASDIFDYEQKQWYDYQVIVVMVVTWLRLFTLFLLVQKISKLLLTLGRMVKDTIAFTFIIVCFFMLMATTFTIRFAEVDPEYYGSMTLSFRSLFDLMVTSYVYRDLGSFNRAHSLLLIVHTFITNVFLLNYLIALLSTVY